MSEDIKPVEAKPKGTGIFTDDDVDTRMKYKAIQHGPEGKPPKVKIEVKQNRQREIKIERR